MPIPPEYPSFCLPARLAWRYPTYEQQSLTHEMKFARDVADRILFMDGGVVVEQGDAKQVIDHPQEERTRKFLASYGK